MRGLPDNGPRKPWRLYLCSSADQPWPNGVHRRGKPIPVYHHRLIVYYKLDVCAFVGRHGVAWRRPMVAWVSMGQGADSLSEVSEVAVREEADAPGTPSASCLACGAASGSERTMSSRRLSIMDPLPQAAYLQAKTEHLFPFGSSPL